MSLSDRILAYRWETTAGIEAISERIAKSLAKSLGTCKKILKLKKRPLRVFFIPLHASASSAVR